MTQSTLSDTQLARALAAELYVQGLAQNDAETALRGFLSFYPVQSKENLQRLVFINNLTQEDAHAAI